MLNITLHGHFRFSEKDAFGRRCIKLNKGDCYFLIRDKDTTVCKIYPIRPQVCKDFPEKDAKECNVDKRSFREIQRRKYK